MAQEISLHEIQKIEFEMLVRFRDWCKKHGLQFCLCGGSMLGAARHKDFIPWDDDVDLFMKRDDYDRMIALYKEDPIDENYELLSAGVENYAYPFVKIVTRDTVAFENHITDPKQVHGFGIDIFPLDKMYPGRKRNFPRLIWVKFLIQLAKTNAKMIRSDRNKLKRLVRSGVMLALKPIAHFTPYSKIFVKLDKMAPYRKNLKKHFIGLTVWPNRWKDIYPSYIFDEYVDVPFRGEMFPAPKDYHTYLTMLYGDYMTPPPPQDRVAHSFRAYWKKDLEEEKA